MAAALRLSCCSKCKSSVHSGSGAEVAESRRRCECHTMHTVVFAVLPTEVRSGLARTGRAHLQLVYRCGTCTSQWQPPWMSWGHHRLRYREKSIAMLLSMRNAASVSIIMAPHLLACGFVRYGGRHGAGHPPVHRELFTAGKCAAPAVTGRTHPGTFRPRQSMSTGSSSM